ncbi:leucine-rich repeat protein [Roseburia sp. AM59-24XD]|uniref:leucine-rich repeat protein n=1 Tax=Roseburia sp. AM59-24XD TaxID=2293138 RepID=UPI0013140E51|nr:leucine-rich repeat protein [Roseburia sp. AM59-24XD]
MKGNVFKKWIVWFLIFSMVITCSNSTWQISSVKAQESDSGSTGSKITVPLSEGEWTTGYGNDSRLEIFNVWINHYLPSTLEGISFKGVDLTFTVSGVDSILQEAGLDSFKAELNFYSSDENIKNIVDETGNVATQTAEINQDGTYTVGYSGDTRISMNYYMAVRFTQLDSLREFSGDISNVKLTFYDAYYSEETTPTATPKPTDKPPVEGTPNYEAEQQTVGQDDDFRVGISYVNTDWSEVFYTDFSTNKVKKLTGIGDYSISYTAAETGDLHMLWLDTNLYSGSRLQLDVTKVHLTSEDGSEETEYTVANNGLQEPGSIWGYRDAWNIKNYAATVKNPYMSYRYFLQSEYDNYKPEYSNYKDRINETIDLFKGKKISIASGSTITVDFMVKANPDVTASPAPSVSPSSEPLVSETPSVSPSSEPLVSETPSASLEPTKDPDVFQINPQDVAALKELINEQSSKGAKVDESIYSMEYSWNMDGRLIEINWSGKAVYGNISFAGLPYLEVFYCGDGNLTSVDVTSNSCLKELFVGYNQLTSIDVSQNADLQMLSVAQNQLTSLDTSNNLQLDTLWCQGNKLDVVYVNKTISESNIYKDSTTKIVRKSPGEIPTAQPTSSAKPTAEPTIAPTIPPKSTATAQPTNTPEVTKDPGSKPGETNPPETSDKPDVTSSPDASVRPSGQPDSPDAPQPSDKPGNTSTTSPTPQVTVTPASTTKPDGQGTNPVSATAQPEPEGSVLTVGNGIYKVISGDGEEPSVIYWLKDSKTASQIVIPDTVESKGIRYKVTSIAKGAFENNKKLKSIVIGKNIVSIGKNAFKNCKNLKKIVIRSEKLKASKVGANILKGTNKKLVIKVPENKQKQYKKFLKNVGTKKRGSQNNIPK